MESCVKRPKQELVAKFLYGTSIFNLLRQMNNTQPILERPATISNSQTEAFIDELAYAVGKILEEMRKKYVPKFSENPINLRFCMKSLLATGKKTPTAEKVFMKMKSMNQNELCDETNAMKNELPSSLITLNKKYGLVKFDVYFSTVISLRFGKLIDPLQASREYMSDNPDLFEQIEVDGTVGDGDHLFYIPKEEIYHQLFETDTRFVPSSETIAQWNRELVEAHENVWYFVASHGWGDCPSGCIHRQNFLLAYDRHSSNVSLLSKAGDDSNGPDKL